MRTLAHHVWSFSGLCLVAHPLVACEGGGGKQQASVDGGAACDDCDAHEGGYDGGGPDHEDAGEVPPVRGSDAAVDAGGPGQGVDAGPQVIPSYPGDLLDLRTWKLTLPVQTDSPGNPDEYRVPDLLTLTMDPYFALTPSKDGVVFRAHAAGATTISSSYPRSELREMTLGGSELASWSTGEGTHRMKVRQAITHVTPVKPHVVAAQIHDANDDVVMVRLQDRDLFVEGGSERLGTLDANYVLGTIYTLEIVAANGTIEVLYDGESKVRLNRLSLGCYFKVGCYTQSNVQSGAAPEDFAQVIVYELTVTHE